MVGENGADGVVEVTGYGTTDDSLSPIAFTAITVRVYDVPDVKVVISKDVVVPSGVTADISSGFDITL
jgi:hypothetical protein